MMNEFLNGLLGVLNRFADTYEKVNNPIEAERLKVQYKAQQEENARMEKWEEEIRRPLYKEAIKKIMGLAKLTDYANACASDKWMIDDIVNAVMRPFIVFDYHGLVNEQCLKDGMEHIKSINVETIKKALVSKWGEDLAEEKMKRFTII